MTKRRDGARTLVRDARAAVRSCLAVRVRLVARLATRVLDAHLAESGLGAAQLGLMLQIAAASDDTIGALAARCDLDQSTLSRNLRGLERAGLVEIAVVEADQRRRAVWLTERGARRLEAALPAWSRAQRDLADALRMDGNGGLAAAAARLGAAVERSAAGNGVPRRGTRLPARRAQSTVT